MIHSTTQPYRCVLLAFQINKYAMLCYTFIDFIFGVIFREKSAKC